MDAVFDYCLAAAILSGGLAAIGVAGWIDHRRAANPMPSLVPMTPIMLLGAIAVLLGITYFLYTFLSGHSGYYIAAALVLFGSATIAITVLIERLRRNNPKPSRSSTTPFMLLGAIVVLVGIVLFLSVSRDEPRKSPGRSRSSLVGACTTQPCNLANRVVSGAMSSNIG